MLLTEDGGWRMVDGGKLREEDGGRKVDVGGRRTEDERWRTEN